MVVRKILIPLLLLLLIPCLTEDMIQTRDLMLRTLNLSAKESIATGNFYNADRVLNFALSLVRGTEYPEYVSSLFKDLGIVFWNLGKIDDSIACFSRGLESIAFSMNNQKEQLFFNIALEIVENYQKAKSARSSKRFDESNTLFKKAIELADSIHCPEFKAKCLRQMSGNYWEQDQIEIFFFLNLLGYQIALSIHHYKEAGICCNNMGLYLWRVCLFSEAAEVIKIGLSLSELAGAEENISICLSNLAVLNYEIGDYLSARKYLEKVIYSERSRKDNSNLAKDLNNLGLVNRRSINSNLKTENLEKSIASLNEAISLSSEVDRPNIWNNLGRSYLAARDYSRADICFKTSLDLLAEDGPKDVALSVMTSRGLCYIEMGRLEEAKELFLRVIKNSETENIKLLWETYYGLGEYHKKTNQFRQAAKYYEKSTDCIEYIRGDLNYESQKILYIKDKTVVYDNLVKILFQLYKEQGNAEYEAQIIKYVEKAKARALYETRNTIKRNTINEDDTAPSQIVFREILRKNSLSSAFQLFNTLINVFWRQNNRNRIIKQSEVQSIEEIIKFSKGHDVAILEYFLMDEFSIGVCINANAVNIVSLPSKSDIERMISGYSRFLSTPGISASVGIAAARRINSKIVKPVLGDIETGDIIVIPDKCLCCLPFEALLKHDNNRDKDEYLITKSTISYMPSASVLVLLSNKCQESEKRYGLVAFGNPTNNIKIYGNIKKAEIVKMRNASPIVFKLKNSQEEVRIAASIFKKNDRKIFINMKASEKNIRLISNVPLKILHLACHGIVDYDDSYNSSLVLSAGKTRDYDGFLRVGELYEMAWRVQLVILSACSSALGEISEYEGVLSLSRAFMGAGAEAIISTLWGIEDEATKIFMRKFYSHLSKQRSVPVALRLAKLDMINSEYSHPRYWAAFVLYGGVSLSIDL